METRENIAGGICLRIISVGCFAIMAALLKLASGHGVVAPEMLFYRAIFALPVVLVWVLARGGASTLITRRPWAHTGRCMLGIMSILCAFQALIMLPLADATTLSFTAPMFATIFSGVILGERIGLHRWLAISTGLVGVIIVMQPGRAAPDVPWEGMAVAILAALGTAGVVTTVRQLRHTEHVAAIVFWFFASSAVVGGFLLPFFGRDHNVQTILILAGAGAAAGLMQISMTASLHKAPISVLSPFDYLQIVGALALGWLIFSEAPTFSTLAGAALIVAGGLYMVWREYLLGRVPKAASVDMIK